MQNAIILATSIWGSQSSGNIMARGAGIGNIMARGVRAPYESSPVVHIQNVSSYRLI